MTSAQNHLQPSNGNNPKKIIAFDRLNTIHYLVLLLVTCLVLSSCDALKKVPREEKEKTNEELDEIKGRRVYNPQTGKWEVATEVDSGVMDTIVWTDPGTDVPPPIKSDVEAKEEVASGENLKKEVYNVAVLLPFMTNNFQELDGKINSKSELAINLYGGMQMAFDELSEEGVKLNITVHDTQASESVTSTLLENEAVRNADMIVGPLAKNNLKLVAEFAKARKKPMVAPLSPSTSITENNPYYLQVSPGLKEHCKAITRHALGKHKAEEIVLVCRNKKAETNRLKYFQDAYKEITGKSDADPLKEFIVTDETVDFSEMDISPYIEPNKTTVFIVPSWSNESFIYSIMRNVSIAKGRNKVVIYGMPQWMEFEQISYDYYENLNLHVSSDADIDTDLDEVKRFKRNFYYKFGTIPAPESYVGYDVMRYFGGQLYKDGTQFQKFIDQNGKDLLHTRFSLMPVAAKDSKSEDYSKIDRYENVYVNILKFKNFHFQLAD